MADKISIDELSDAAGVVVRGVDLRGPIDPNVADELRKAYAEYSLILFRKQQLTPEQQASAVGIFGPILDELGDGTSHSLVSNIDPGKAYIEAPDIRLPFHSDLPNTGNPPWGISLHAKEIFGDSPPTKFVNAQRAYNELPPELRQRIDELDVIDMWPEDNPPEYYSDTLTHGAVIVHPRNGRRQIHCNELWTNAVVGLEPDEARSVLDEIFSYLYDPSNIYEHDWEVGDLLIWDNIAMQHGRDAIPPGCRRRLQLVVLGVSSPELMRATQGTRDAALMGVGARVDSWRDDQVDAELGLT